MRNNCFSKRVIFLCVLLIIVVFIAGCSKDDQYIQYKIQIVIEGQGSVIKDPNSDSYNNNSKVKLTAESEEGWQFKEWKGDLTSAENPSYVTVNSDLDIIAVFKEITNSVPIAADDTAETNEDTSVIIEVLANDSDPDGDEISISALKNGSNGTTVSNDDGSVTYTPDTDFNGDDSFSYEISDGKGAIATATVSVTISAVNDAPVLNKIGNKSVNEGELLVFTVTASDIDGDSLNYGASNLPAGASFDQTTQEFNWTPDYGAAGNYSVDFEVSDGSLTDSEAIVITVGDEDRPPVLDSIADKSVDEGSSLIFTVTASDPDGDELRLSAADLPSEASFDTTSGVFDWTPGYEDAGSYDVTFTAESNGLTDEETITITVNDINRSPSAIDDTAETDEDTSVIIEVLANDSDPDGDVLSISVLNSGSKGTTLSNNDGSVTYTPDKDVNGDDSFSYEISDGKGGTASATVTVTINSINDVPVAEEDSATVDEDGTVLIDVLSNDTDVDGDDLSIIGYTSSTNGSVAQEDNKLRYTPDADYYGTDSFDYDIADGKGGVATAVVNITVNPISGTMEGIVTNDKGEPVENVQIEIVTDNSSWEDYTDENGFYRIINIEPGSHDLYARAEGYDTYQELIDIVLGDNIKDITLSGPGLQSLSGTVVDSMNSPKANQIVYLYDRYYKSEDATYLTEETDADGNYQFNDLLIGEYTLATSVDGNIHTVPVEIIDSNNIKSLSLSEQIRTQLHNDDIDRNDIYEFPITIISTGIYEFRTGDYNESTSDTIVEIYDSNNQLIASNDDSCNKPYSYIKLNLSSGDFFLYIKEKNQGSLKTRFEINLIE